MPIPIELLSLIGRSSGGDPGNGRPAAPSPPAVPPPTSQTPQGGSQGPEDERPPERGNGRPG
jgi:hypothetical protein